MSYQVNEVDKVEIFTLQDNYIDLVSRDDSDMVVRARPIVGKELKNSILAEHGFAAVVTVTRGDRSRSILFDFGFSEHGAATNADSLGVDLSEIEAVVVSHGHLDHVGGLAELMQRVGKTGIEMVLHPSAFRNPRYMKITEERKIYFPAFTREKVEAAGVALIETQAPRALLDGDVLFLGEIPRKTEFERGVPYLFYEDEGVEKLDPLDDDSAIVIRVKGKGLVVLSGCAHAGIVNTLHYARELTGEDRIFAVMGGFHLSGPDFAPVIEPTVRALEECGPQYIVPTHCTGRNACRQMEDAMPEKFLLNMSGTKLIFAA
jgi:7,8-dihydropterin-6-yl-methyl-4-(beta-D-ribofuranosyl)aminobenzene 5'-phosphate synthase